MLMPRPLESFNGSVAATRDNLTDFQRARKFFAFTTSQVKGCDRCSSKMGAVFAAAIANKPNQRIRKELPQNRLPEHRLDVFDVVECFF